MGSFLSCSRSLTRGWMMAVLLFLMPAFAAGQAFVQSNSNTTRTTTTSLQVPFTTPQGPGNLNVVVVGWADTSSTVQSVTDSDGNLYLLATGTNDTTGVSQAIYYAKNITGDTGSTTNTVTVTFNQPPVDEDVRILEYSGLDTTNPLDVTAGAVGTSTAPASPSVTTNSATDLLIGAGTSTSIEGFTAAGGFGAGAGFAQRSFPGGYGDMVEDQNVTATGSYSATATLGSSASWVMQIVAFRATGQTPPSFSAPTVASVSPTSGFDAGGDPITITGTNFELGATVVFSNGTTMASAVNCSVASTTSIDCTTPDFPVGSADITVTNVDAQSSGPFAGFSFAPTTPGITSVSPTSGPTNGGNTVVITGSDFVTGASVVVGNVVADSVVVKDLNHIQANFPAHTAGAANVSVTNPNQHTGALPNGYTYTATTGISFVQVQDVALGGTQSSISATYALAQNAGDLNVVVISWGDASALVASVKDSAGNSYVPALSPIAANGLSQSIWYAKNVKAAAALSNKVSVTFDVAATTPDLRILEYSGVDTINPVDGGHSASSTVAGIAADSGSFTTTFATDLVIAAVTPSTTTASAGAGFTTVNLPTSGDYVEHQITQAAGTVDAQATLTSDGSWVMQAVAFKQASTQPPPGSFIFSVSPGSQQVTAGSSASYSLTVTGQNNFTSPVSLSATCPQNVQITCSISPNPVTPGSSPVVATLTVTTTGPTASLIAPGKANRLLPLYAIWLPLPGIALAGVGLGSRRRKLGLGLTCFLLIALTLLLVGCGGGGSTSGGGGGGGNPGTTAGTYNIKVTATSASQPAQTFTVTLTVQ